MQCWNIPLFFALLASLTQTKAQSTTCVAPAGSNCKCKFPNNYMMDLSPLDKATKPAFKDKLAPDSYLYSYNPCTGFSCSTSATTSVCQSTSSGSKYDAGDASLGLTYTTRNGKLAIKYVSLDSVRTTYVALVCDCKVEGDLVAHGVAQTGGTEYDMTLTTRYACDHDCGGSGGSAGGLSGGDILLIIFFVLFFVYFVAGCLINRFVRHKEGREMVPNESFWTNLPGLVKDGGLFVVNNTCRRGQGQYNEIKS